MSSCITIVSPWTSFHATTKPNLKAPCSLSSTIPSSRLTFTSHPLNFKLRARPIKARSTTSNNAESFYDLLGIPENGTTLEIKQAYKKLARKYHPDVSPPDRVEEYTRRFIRVKEAYQTLSSPTSRALYDRDMAFGLQFPFFTMKPFQCKDQLRWQEKLTWQRIWKCQLTELQRRSIDRDLAGENLSWGTTVRRRRETAINL